MAQPARNPGYAGETRRIGFFDTTRVGFIYGQDDAERVVRQLARTCHINFSSLKMGGGTTAKAALDYAFREGEEHGPVPDEKVDELKEKAEEAWAGGGEKEIAARGKAIAGAEERNAKAAELECTAGDRKRVEDACERIEESAVVRKGRTAERFLIQQVIEQPGDSTPAQRKACAEALVQHWEDRGHPATAAVHGNGKVQPHVHVQATARPVDAADNVDRSALLWTGKQAVRDERQALAGIVNEHCPSAVLFHGGRHEDVNIDREARKEAGLAQIRLPRRAQHRPAKYELDDSMPERLAVVHDRGRSWSEAEAARRKAEEARKAVERETRRQARAAATEAERQAREDRKAARERHENRQAELRDLSEKQTEWLTGAHRDAGRELPDLDDDAGRAAAWAFARDEQKRKKAEDEAAEKNKEGGDERGSEGSGEDAGEPEGSKAGSGREISREEVAASLDEAGEALRAACRKARQIEGMLARRRKRELGGAAPDPYRKARLEQRSEDARRETAKSRRALVEWLRPRFGRDAGTAAGVLLGEPGPEMPEGEEAAARQEAARDAEPWRPRLAGPVEVANARAALDSAPELDEAMRARRRVEVVGLPLRPPQADAWAATQAKIAAAALPALTYSRRTLTPSPRPITASTIRSRTTRPNSGTSTRTPPARSAMRQGSRPRTGGRCSVRTAGTPSSSGRSAWSTSRRTHSSAASSLTRPAAAPPPSAAAAAGRRRGGRKEGRSLSV